MKAFSQGARFHFVGGKFKWSASKGLLGTGNTSDGSC